MGKQITVFGYPAIAHKIVRRGGLIISQVILLEKFSTFGADTSKLTVRLALDSLHDNEVESFFITGEISWRGKDSTFAGAHDVIRCQFPELASLIPWNGCSIHGPRNYVEGTIYLAGDLDLDGMRSGETKPLTSRESGEQLWRLVAVAESGESVELRDIPPLFAAKTAPYCNYSLKYMPLLRVGEGKRRELDAARRAAIWPEATDEELCLPKPELEASLLARLPTLLEKFKATMLAVGFEYPQNIEQRSFQ